MEKSIRELGCEYLDLCLVHWPEAQKPGTFEPDTGVTMQETWCAAALSWGRHPADKVYTLRTEQLQQCTTYVKVSCPAWMQT